MALVDTCGWIEWLTGSALCAKYEPYFERIDAMIVSTSVQYELYKWTTRKKGMQLALEAVALTEQAKVVPLSSAIALAAADFSMEYKLSFADAIVYATARFYHVDLITSDDHFQGLPAVRYFPKASS